MKRYRHKAMGPYITAPRLRGLTVTQLVHVGINQMQTAPGPAVQRYLPLSHDTRVSQQSRYYNGKLVGRKTTKVSGGNSMSND